MAIVPMQKVAIIAHKSLQKPLVDFLYDEGVLQIVNASEHDVLTPSDELEYTAADIEYAINTLREFASKETLKQCTNVSKKPDAVKHAVQHTDIKGIVASLRELELADTELTTTIQQKKLEIEQLSLWVCYPYSVTQHANPLQSVRIVTGTVPHEFAADFKAAVALLPMVEVQNAGANEKVESFACLVDHSSYSDFIHTATSKGFAAIEFPKDVREPVQERENAKVTVLQSEKKLEAHKQVRKDLAIELPKLYQVATYIHWLQERSVAHKSLAHTEETVRITGWMPKRKVSHLEGKLQRECGAVALFSINKEIDEEAPIAIKNPKWFTPFESVTTLYGLPTASEMDPTVALTPFFIVYFALCLTDAGYGLVLALLFGGYLLKTRKSIDEAKLPWLLFISGIATILISIPFGGWFGLTPDQVPSMFTKQGPEGLLFKGQVWNLGLQSGINFLQNLALVLGITHLFFGMFLAGYHKWVHGNKAQAFWQDFTSHLLLGSILFYVFASEPLKIIATYTLVLATILMIWGKGYGNTWYMRPIFGVLGVVNFAIGLLSNGLSYLRLLALGLVTGAIALAINQVAIEIGKLLPIYLSIPAIIIICTAGHLVSIALNTLGSFIHSGRLQFIEFFSQFFEGGGQGYSPFRRT